MTRALDRAALRRCAEILLPAELSTLERNAAVDAFLRWVRGYRSAAEMDHGYGFTRLRETEPSPAGGYAQDLAALEAVARRDHGGDVASLDEERLRPLLSHTIDTAAPDDGRMPARPDTTHVLVALMTHYFRSPEAADRCYGVRIRREICRGLFTDLDGLEPRADD